MSAQIRPPQPADRPRWEDLWEQYLRFYTTALPPERTGRLWSQILDPADPIECLVADLDGTVVGIAQFVPHIDTWEDTPACYLQDLFVDPAARSHGIGRLLIEAVDRRRRAAGWSYLYWQTEHDNHTARRLYDAITGGASEFIVYQHGIGET